MHEVITAVLGGGHGTRLWPLTRYRSKPAVPIGGRFRLIDIPLSNSLHAGIDRIYVLTQFNSASLHRHIAQAYRFDVFSRGFVNILAAQQTVGDDRWYQGTADAVRQNVERLCYTRPTEIVVLSGDQLYLMNLRKFVEQHRSHDADLTIAVTPVTRSAASDLGIMRVSSGGRIVEFVEKPEEPSALDRLTPAAQDLERLGFDAPEGSLLASMGIYVFRREVLQELLDGTTTTDFGREVIPEAITTHRVFAFGYGGYWRDIGTIPSFLEANLDLAGPVPLLNLYDPDFPIYSHPRFLPGSRVHRCEVRHSILSEGSVLSDSRISRSIVGLRAVVRRGSTIENSYIMGASEFEPPPAADVPIGVGEDCHIRNAILDLNVRVGDGSKLTNAAGVEAAEAENYVIRGGIIVVPKHSVIPPGTEI